MKYIVIVGAILSVALYYIVEEMVWQLRNRLFRRRLIIAVLIMALLISQTDIVNIFMRADADKVSAAEQETESGVETEDTIETPNTEGRIITAFAELPDDIREQIVPVGTALEELILPDTLEAVYANTDIDADTDAKTDTDTSDSQVGWGNVDQDNGDAEEVEPGEGDDNEDVTPNEETEQGEEENRLEENGTEAETPLEEEGNHKKDPTETGSDEVAVQTETGSFVMPEYRTENVIEVQTLEMEPVSEHTEITEETVTIENITWQSEPEYDGDTEGEYIFTAVLPEGCELTEEVSIPEITVIVGDIALQSADIMPIAITFDGGSGSSGSPWLISSLATLQRFRDDVTNNGNDYYGYYIKLTTDIDLKCSSTDKWTRIGMWTAPFKGTFDGDGHTISGLYVDESSNDQGLFGCVKNGTIMNLSVSGYVHVPDSGTVIYNVAGIVGIVIEGTIENCTNYVTVSGRDYVGGICGLAGKDSKITNCTNKGSVTGQAVVGGIVGKSDNTNASSKSEGTAGTISGCTNSGTITAKNVQGGAEDHTGAGGIAGANHDSGVIKDCRNDGQVNGYVRVGGIVGYDQPGNKGTIKNCYNTGNVYGYNNGIKSDDGYEHGGIVGYAPYTAIEQCYNTGSIYGKDQIGGIAGKIDKNESYIKNSCNLGSVRAYGNDCGGIAGQTYNEVKITYCYSSGTLTCETNRGGIVGKSADGWVWMGNCYYLSGTVSGECGTGNNYKSDGGEIKTMTKTELESGEFALYLQGKLGSSLVWVQNLKNVYGNSQPTSKGPIPTGDSNLKVLTVTFMKRGTGTSYNTTHAKRYTNPKFGVTLPTDLSPSDSGKYKVVWWTSANAPATGKQFTADSTVTSDTTVYAYEQEMYAGESSTITKTITYGDGLTLKLSDSMKYTAGTSSAGKFTYTIGSGNSTLNATISGDTLTIPTTANAGTYTLEITASEKSPQLTTYALGSNGTNDVTLTVKVIINKANSDVTTKPTANSLTYTGSGQALVTAGIGSGGTIKYSTTSSSSGFSTTIPKGTNAGTYTVWYKVVGDVNHNDTTAQSVTVTIEKATTTVAVTGAEDLVYTGKPQPLIQDAVITPAVGTLLYSMDGVKYSTNIPTGTDAKNYTLWYKVEGTTNYTGVSPQSITVNIAPAQAEVTAPVGNNLTYTGKEQTLVTAGTSTLGALKYSLTENGTYTTSIPTAANAGSYTVWYKVDDDAKHNYKGVAAQSVTVNIAPAQAEVTAPVGNKLTYTGKEQTLVTAGTSTFGTLKYSLTANGTYTTSLPTGINAGSYTVWYKVDDDENGNYKGAAAQSVTVNIAPAQAKVVTAPVGNKLTYTGKEQKLVTAGKSTFGTLSYSTESNGTYTDSIPTGLNAGQYTVWYKVNGTNDYIGTSEQSVSVSIAKAAPTVTITAPNLTYTGRTQALIKTGRTSGGTLEYRLGDIQGNDQDDDRDGGRDDDQNGGQSNEWKTDIPTATEIGTYTVYYRVVGDENYTNAAERYVTVRILAAAPKDDSNSGSGSSSGSDDSSNGQQTDDESNGSNSPGDTSAGSVAPPTDSSGTESRTTDEDTPTERPTDSQNKKKTDPKLGDGTTDPESEDRTTDSKAEETVQGTETLDGTGWDEIPDGKIVPAEVDKGGKIVVNADTANAETTGAKTGNADSNGTGTDRTTDDGGAAIITGTVGTAQSAATIFTVGNGVIIVTVAGDRFPGAVGVSDTVAAVNAVLTPEQIQRVNNGERIEIRVEVTDISDQVSKEDKDIFENGLKAGRASGMAATNTAVQADRGLIIGVYIDISVYIRIGDSNWDAITQADEPIEVIIEIPDELKSSDRIYYIARSHEGAFTLLDDLDSEPDTITIKTELFSTYAIVYRQGVGTDIHGANGLFASLSWTAVALWGLGILVILGIAIFLILVVRRREEKEVS